MAGLLYIDANGKAIRDARGFYLGLPGDGELPSTETELENTVAPVISGTPTRGNTLSSTTGTWESSFPIEYAYQWHRNGQAIFGARFSTYTIVYADIGRDLTCVVTADNGFFVKSATSNSLTVTGNRSNPDRRKRHERTDWRWYKAPG